MIRIGRTAAPPDVATVYLARGRTGEVPTGTDWLTAGEQLVEAGLAIAKRRNDWRLGRWLAKRAVGACLADRSQGIPASEVEVTARPDGAPEARVCSVGESGVIPVSISISHSEGVGLAVAAIGDVALGCDVERIAPRSERFVKDYLTRAERQALDRTPPPERSTAVTLIWSAKEAALKVLKQGLRMDTRTVDVAVPGILETRGPPPDAGPWSRIQVRIPGEDTLEGYWWADEGFMWTIIGDRPVRLATA